MSQSVIDDSAGNQFALHMDGTTATLEYRLHGDRLHLLHTEVPEAFRGQGVGGRVVEAALAKASRHPVIFGIVQVLEDPISGVAEAVGIVERPDQDLPFGGLCYVPQGVLGQVMTYSQGIARRPRPSWEGRTDEPKVRRHR